MINQEKKELLVGALAFALGALFLLSVHKINISKMESDTYEITAKFKKADGIYEGSDVRLAGIKIGSIKKATINKFFNAVMILEINKNIDLPDDSSAAIETDSFFGSKYIEIQPGGSEDLLENNSSLEYTQDSLVIEDLLDKIIAMGKARQQKQQAEKQNQPQEQQQINQSVIQEQN